jgi:hypothetical protein
VAAAVVAGAIFGSAVLLGEALGADEEDMSDAPPAMQDSSMQDS